MKIYNYQCQSQSCQHIFEGFVKDTDQEVACEKCGSTTARMITSPCFILKGVGVCSNGSFKRAKEGPKLDKDLLRLDDVSLNRELGLPDNCA